MARIQAGAPNAALEHQWIAKDLSKVAAAQDLNLERRVDLETARDILNDAHVKLGTLLEREGLLVKDGVMEDETPLERFHYDAEAVRRMEATVRAEMRSEGLSYDQVEARDWKSPTGRSVGSSASSRRISRSVPNCWQSPAM